MNHARCRFWALVVTLVFLFGLTLPASALATSFANQYPVGAVQLPPRIVGTTAFSAIALDTRSIQLKIDGVAYVAQYRSGSVSGYWSATEVWNPTLLAWTVKWTWVPTTADPNKMTIYTYPTFTPPLTNGVHTVTVTIKDRNGLAATDTWTFSYNTAPVLGTPTPADGSTVATRTPALSIPVTGSGTLSATATVNGAPATAAVSGGVVRVTSPTLPNDATCTVSVAVTDASGNRTAGTWRFFVQVLPQMPSTVNECTSCHQGYENDPNMHDDCMACHNGMVDKPHAADPVTYHTRADVSACKPCHVSDITVEHAQRLASDGGSITCVDCHSSDDPDVMAAISAHRTECSACHGTADHSTVHTKTNSAFCAKAGCHVATNLIDEHVTTPINPPSTLTCETCHESTRPAVSGAIAAHDKNCSACHGQMIDGHDAMHESVMDPECLYCHAGSISQEHIVLHNTGGTRTCESCHDSTNPRIMTAIAEKDRTCAGCHDDAGHNADHASGFDGLDCGACHVGNVQLEHQRTTASSATARCANCHVTPDSVVVDALGGQPWSRGCVQTGCHITGSAARQHGNEASAHAVGAPAPTCIQAGCHSGTDLSAIHSEASTTTPSGTRSGCLVCHSTDALPASGQCLGCHPERAASHGYDPAKHIGTDAAVRAASLSDGGEERGCSDTLPGQRGCHDITSLGELHREAPDGCNTCHGAGRTPSRECLTCHPTTGSGGGNYPETLASVSWYHHNNVKYLISSTDATPNPYYNGDGSPDAGWYDSAYYNDCSDLCHHDYVTPGTFSALTGQRMWFSAPGGGGWYGPQNRMLTSAEMTMPAGAYLDFSTYYLLLDSWGDGAGYVEVSVNGGSSWGPLTGTVNGATVSSLSGNSSAWVQGHYDLSAYAGQKVQVRFRFDDLGGWCGGWALDDIVIGGDDGEISSEGAESTRSGWTSTYWIRSMSAYPAF